MENHANYISLKDATLFCDHSQDYLNLLVRKGRLKAVKIGRNWVTTKQWLDDYLKFIEQKKIRRASCRELFGDFENEAGGGADKPAVKNENNYFSGYFAGNQAAAGNGFNFLSVNLPPALMVVFSMALWFSVVVIFGGQGPAIAARDNFFAVAQYQGDVIFERVGGSGSIASNFFEAAVDPKIILRGSASVWQGVTGSFKLVSDAGKNIAERIGGFTNYLIAGRSEKIMITEGSAVPVDNIVFDKNFQVLEENITSDTRSRFDDFREEFGMSEGGGGKESGLVVIPSTGDEMKDGERKDEIKKSFSDEVTVNPADGESGIIIPQFKDKQGDEYIYMMVPIDKTGNEK